MVHAEETGFSNPRGRDEKWKERLEELQWPTKKLPEIAGGIGTTLSALTRRYLFVSLFKTCAESLASENASRLEAMQRAKKISVIYWMTLIIAFID